MDQKPPGVVAHAAFWRLRQEDSLSFNSGYATKRDTWRQTTDSETEKQRQKDRQTEAGRQAGRLTSPLVQASFQALSGLPAPLGLHTSVTAPELKDSWAHLLLSLHMCMLQGSRDPGIQGPTLVTRLVQLGLSHTESLAGSVVFISSTKFTH